MLPVCFLIDDALALATRWKRRVATVLIAAALASGVFVQILGNAYYWDVYIRITKEARERWLGTANSTGTFTQQFGGGVCGPCFEDMHALHWLPPFQPIAGHWWLLRHAPRGHGWAEAEADAAWHRYTRLQLNIATTYARAPGRADWWYRDYEGVAPTEGVVLIVAFGLCALGAASAFAHEARRHSVASRRLVGV
jgi:hypothetical protein